MPRALDGGAGAANVTRGGGDRVAAGVGVCYKAVTCGGGDIPVNGCKPDWLLEWSKRQTCRVHWSFCPVLWQTSGGVPHFSWFSREHCCPVVIESVRNMCALTVRLSTPRRLGCRLLTLHAPVGRGLAYRQPDFGVTHEVQLATLDHQSCYPRKYCRLHRLARTVD